MKPVKQTKRGGPDVPPEERGDCWDACLASILEVTIDETHVPHSDDPAHHWWDESQRVLAQHGYAAVEFGGEPPSGYWMASVPSLNLGVKDDGEPVLHVVVMKGWKVAHDPALGECYEVGTSLEDLDCKRGYALVPLHPISLKAAA